MSLKETTKHSKGKANSRGEVYEPVKRNRYYFIDLIKIVSIFIIFVTHYLMDIGLLHNMFDVNKMYSFIDRPNIHLGMLACSLFIICSGFGLSVYSEKKYNGNINHTNILSFYKNRLSRVLIPFYISYLVYFIISATNLGTIFMFGGLPKWKIIYTIFGIDEYVSANGIKTFSLGVGEWYLGCLILCYLAFPLIYNLSKKMPKITFCLMTIYFLITPLFINNFFIVPHMNFLIQIYNFYLGILLYNSGILNNKNRLLFVLSLVLILFIYIYPTKINIYYIFICSFCSICCFILYSFFEKYLVESNGFKLFITIFNKYSYEFFLCHHFVIYQVNYLLKYRLLSKFEFVYLFLIDFIITMLFAFSINLIAKKIFSLKLFNNKK